VKLDISNYHSASEPVPHVRIKVKLVLKHRTNTVQLHFPCKQKVFSGWVGFQSSVGWPMFWTPHTPHTAHRSRHQFTCKGSSMSLEDC